MAMDCISFDASALFAAQGKLTLPIVKRLISPAAVVMREVAGLGNVQSAGPPASR
jgi:hypothetical protein